MSVKVSEARSIGFLINKYKTKQPGEKWSTQYDTMNKKNYKLTKKIMKAKTFGSQMYMSKNQIDRVIHIIETVDNLQKLHRGLDDHELIFIICYFIKQQDNRDFRPDKNGLCKTFKYINDFSFKKVLCAIPKYYYKNI